MSVQAALIRKTPGPWEICDVELDEPGPFEARVRMVAAGLCHSDYHFNTADHTPGFLPLCGGHEGAGVVEAVGSAVTRVRPGDHIVTSFIPSCGRCRWCASGRQNLCDNGATLRLGTQLDGSFRMHLDGQNVGQNCGLGTFAEKTVMSELSCIKIDDDIPLSVAALVSCGVGTGWGSAVNGGLIEPGHVVIVMGVGGIGMHAVQGARHAGATHIIAVDPVEMRRDVALTVGATHVAGHIDEAADIARHLTNGQGADSAVICVSVLTGEHIGQAASAVRKAGIVVLTSAPREDERQIPISVIELVLYQKRIQGTLYGMLSPNRDIPRLLDLWRSGQLKLGGELSTPFPLEQINDAYRLLEEGKIVRGVLNFID